MENRNDKRKHSQKEVIVLFVIFCAIVLTEATTGIVNSSWVVLMGLVVIGLSLSVSLLPRKKDGDILKDR